MLTWLRTRRAMVRELAALRGELADCRLRLEEAADERDGFAAKWEAEQRAHQVTQKLIEAFEENGVRDLFAPPRPRTAEEELAAMRAHVAALEERLHLLQQANMAADRPY